MSLGRNPFRALCEGIYAFQRELGSAGMTSSLVVNLDPHDFKGVLHSAETWMGGEMLPDGSVRIMDAIVRPRRLKVAENNGNTRE
jgi:hypothetical protein